METDSQPPFTRDDFDAVAQCVVEGWRSGLDRNWSVPAGTVEWSCLRTADHCVDAVLAVAFFLASRKQDAYPDFGWGDHTAGDNARPETLVEALETVSRVLSSLIATAEPDTRAVIWRRPKVATGGPNDFAARGALELLLHGHDVCTGLGIPLDPPQDACARLREHTRGWPHWTSPGWSNPPTTENPWVDLLIGSGRS
jgi:hypothetical protein